MEKTMTYMETCLADELIHHKNWKWTFSPLADLTVVGEDDAQIPNLADMRVCGLLLGMMMDQPIGFTIYRGKGISADLGRGCIDECSTFGEMVAGALLAMMNDPKWRM